MFKGEYHPTLDEKGRIAIPARIRKAFGENAVINRLVVTHGFGKYIMGYREEDWREFVERKLKPMSQEEPKNMKWIRFLLGGAVDCDLDRQGRIVLPAYLIDYAAIKKNTAIIGLYNRVEIWDYDSYQSYKPGEPERDGIEWDIGF
jgi:MraZ protein